MGKAIGRTKQIWHFIHRDKDGQVIWEDRIENALADEGERDILGVYYRAETAPTEFYIGLVNGAPSESTTLSTLSGEPSGNGYSRQLVERSSVGFPTVQQDVNGDWQVVSKTVTFAASGGSIGPVDHAFLATTSDNTGKFVAYVALSQSRTLADGETLDVTLTITQQ